jgi:hypothetical protein
LLETSAELMLRYTNETIEPLALAGSAHRLYLNGSYVGLAVSNESMSIPQLGTATQTVTIHLENLALVRKLRQLPSDRMIKYRLESTLHRAEGKGLDAFRVVSTGELDLSSLTQKLGD